MRDPVAIEADRRAGVVASTVANGTLTRKDKGWWTPDQFFASLADNDRKRGGMIRDPRMMKALCEADKGGELTPARVA